MATYEDTTQAVLDAIEAAARQTQGNIRSYNSQVVKDLAEAYAWLTRPDQAHGGQTNVDVTTK